MIRILTASGLTAVPGDISVPVGYQWKLRYAVMIIVVGGGTGTRTAVISMKPSGNGIGEIMYLTPVETSTNSTSGDTIVAAGGLAIQGGNGSNSDYSTWNVLPILNPSDTLSFNNSSIINLDTVTYYISLEEVSNADGL